MTSQTKFYVPMKSLRVRFEYALNKQEKTILVPPGHATPCIVDTENSKIVEQDLSWERIVEIAYELGVLTRWEEVVHPVPANEFVNELARQRGVLTEWEEVR